MLDLVFLSSIVAFFSSLLFFWLCPVACGIFSQPGIELGLPALGGWSPRHWPTREVALYLRWFLFSVAETFFFGLVISWLSAHNQEVLVAQSVQLFATPRTVAHQAPLSMEFSRQEYWSGLPLPSPGHNQESVRLKTDSHWACGKDFSTVNFIE